MGDNRNAVAGDDDIPTNILPIHIPWEFIMKAVNNKEIKNDELLGPLRKTGGGDLLQIFVDDLLWMTRAMKPARESATK